MFYHESSVWPSRGSILLFICFISNNVSNLEIIAVLLSWRGQCLVGQHIASFHEETNILNFVDGFLPLEIMKLNENATSDFVKQSEKMK